ncbi:DNA polymerase III subunit beta [Candidatus Collierbacteria bacterium]|nr:DNA polymerase III subunit beta [Candidatus Collierbacteria bacterium]
MKISVLSENLKKGMGVAIKAVANRPQLPILSNVLLRANKDGLLILATDLEISLIVKVGAKVEEEGDMAVPAKLFFDLINSLPSGAVLIKREKQALNISGNRVKVEVVGQAAEEFPSLPRFKGKGLMVDSQRFKKVIEAVGVSVAKDDTRPILTGILWQMVPGEITLVATDGYRLGMDRLKGVEKDESFQSEKVILPARALMELSRVVGEEASSSKIEVDLDEEKQQVMFRVGDVEMSSRLIAGDFPPFEQIIPIEHKLRVMVSREMLLEAVKRASLFARDNSNIVKLEIGEDMVLVKAESSQAGRNESEVEAKTEGEGMVVAFNARYLLDFLSASEEKQTIMEFEGELKPGVFLPEGVDFKQIIMPIRQTEN